MSEEKSKGISLRTKRKNRPAISAPKQISSPIQQIGGVPRSNGGQAAFDPPPQRPQVGGKVLIQIISPTAPPSLLGLAQANNYCRPLI